eukprot:UN01826
MSSSEGVLKLKFTVKPKHEHFLNYGLSKCRARINRSRKIILRSFKPISIINPNNSRPIWKCTEKLKILIILHDNAEAPDKNPHVECK